MNNKKKCFVIMPIAGTKSCTEQEWTGIYTQMIKPAVTGSKLGFICERAKPRTGAFIKDILEGLNRSDVVIADLTDRNPNVCYELGIRHTLKNRTILIAQNIDDVPSDLQSYWVVVYQKDLTGASEFKNEVRNILKEMQKDPDKSDSPVADFLQLKNVDILAYEKSANLKKLCALLSEMSRNLQAVDPVLKICQENQEARKKKKQTSVLSLRFENNCLAFLLADVYILLPGQLLKSLSTLNSFIITTNNRLALWASEGFGKSVEESLISSLPLIKQGFEMYMRHINKIRIDYINDNYHEIEAPPVMLASPEHEEYLKITK
jgi:hypothetical protein